MIKHLTPKTEEEIEKILPKNKHFKLYYDKKIKDMEICAKRDDVSLEECIKIRFHGTILEHKLICLAWYERKDCHSFWHSECINMGEECHHCNQFFSTAEWDKMTKKEKDNTKGG